MTRATSCEVKTGSEFIVLCKHVISVEEERAEEGYRDKKEEK